MIAKKKKNLETAMQNLHMTYWVSRTALSRSNNFASTSVFKLWRAWLQGDRETRYDYEYSKHFPQTYWKAFLWSINCLSISVFRYWLLESIKSRFQWVQQKGYFHTYPLSATIVWTSCLRSFTSISIFCTQLPVSKYKHIQSLTIYSILYYSVD